MDQIGLGAFKEICFYSKIWPGSVMGTGLIVLEKWELIDYNNPHIVSILKPTSSGLSASN